MGSASKKGPKPRRRIATPAQRREGTPTIFRPDSPEAASEDTQQQVDAVNVRDEDDSFIPSVSNVSDRTQLKPNKTAWWKPVLLSVAGTAALGAIAWLLSVVWANNSSLVRLDERVANADKRVQALADRLDRIDQNANTLPHLTKTDIQLEIEKLRHELTAVVAQDREHQGNALQLLEKRISKLEK